mgnify:CR=1 FL=1
MNMFKRVLFSTVVLFSHFSLVAQEPLVYINFDDQTIKEKMTSKEDAVYSVDLQQSQFERGLKGRSLDLSENATLRRPIKLSKLSRNIYSLKKSFAVQIWVKTIKNAMQGTVIASNKTVNNLENVGWQIYTQENGAWAFNISDGKSQYNYKPTVGRQQINDGEWHQIVVSIDASKSELWLYLDGINVAIYNTPNLKSVETDLKTIIGGTDEKWEYGSYGQWNAFNGYIDEVKIWENAINSKEVVALYSEFQALKIIAKDYSPKHLKILTWNIWHGGHRYGDQVGLQRVIETIKATNADVIGLIETYGSGEKIADALGYHFYLISSNLSIMSKFPIKETIKAFQPFNFGGALIDLGNDKELVFVDTLLHYLPDYSGNVVKREMSSKELVKDEGKTRFSEVKEILKEISPYLKSSNKIPVIMVGDFNGGSHLDWLDKTSKNHYDYVVKWPVSLAMEDSEFIDSYRELHINPLLDPGLTWSPRAATSSINFGLRDRIDYIYYKGNLKTIESKVIDYHPIMFPSDHAGVLTVFEIKE